MKKLYEKNELTFAIIWILWVTCVRLFLQSQSGSCWSRFFIVVEAYSPASSSILPSIRSVHLLTMQVLL